MCEFINSIRFTWCNTRDVICYYWEVNVWEGEVTLKPDWDLQYCSSGINKKKHSESSVYVCVYCYAYVSIHPSGSAAKAANGYYLLYMITPIASWNTVLYIRVEQQNSLAAVDQLVPVSLSF